MEPDMSYSPELVKEITNPYKGFHMTSKRPAAVIAQRMINDYIYENTIKIGVGRNAIMDRLKRNINPKLLEEVTEQVKLMLLDNVI